MAELAPAITSVAEASSRQVLATVTLAFATDPVARYWWRDAAGYAHWWPRFAHAIGRNGYAAGAVDATGDFDAVAMWMPPGVETDPADIGALDLEGDPESDAISARLREEMARFHPQEPHWYLWILATDPHWQGRGLGSALMQHRLALIDAAGAPAYLEASRPALVPYYESFGFRPIGLIEVADVPPITPMYRAAR